MLHIIYLYAALQTNLEILCYKIIVYCDIGLIIFISFTSDILFYRTLYMLLKQSTVAFRQHLTVPTMKLFQNLNLILILKYDIPCNQHNGTCVGNVSNPRVFYMLFIFSTMRCGGHFELLHRVQLHTKMVINSPILRTVISF